MIGDVMRIQRTPRLTPAACSLTRFFRVFFGQRTSDMDVLRIQRTPSWCQPKFIILGDGVDTTANDRVKLCNFKFVAYTDIYRVWSGRYLFKRGKDDTWVEFHARCCTAARKIWIQMGLPLLLEIIAEGMWRAMGWVCDQRPNADIVSLKQVFQVEKFSMVACHTY